MAAAAQAAVAQFLDEVTSRFTRCWGASYGDPGPAFANPAN